MSLENPGITTQSNDATNDGDDVDDAGNVEKCPVCLDEFPLDDLVPFDRCNHSLCASCRTTILMTQNRCPVCRTLIRDEETTISTSLAKLKNLLATVMGELHTLSLVNSRSHFNNFERTSPTEDAANADVSRDTATPAISRDDYRQVRDDIQRLLQRSAETGLLPLRPLQQSQPIPINISQNSNAPNDGGPNGLNLGSILSPLMNTLASVHSIPGMLVSSSGGSSIEDEFDTYISIASFSRPSSSSNGNGTERSESDDVRNMGNMGNMGNSMPRLANHQPSFFENVRNALRRFHQRM